MAEQFDVTIIGSGPGGYVAAVRGAQMGLKVAIIEKEKDARLGGTCGLRGCIPTKALLQSAHLYEKAGHFAEHGIKIENLGYDWTQVQKRKSDIVNKNAAGVTYLMKKNKITVFNGLGKITGKGKIEVALAGGKKETVETKNIIIATGSVVKPFPGFEVDGKQVVNSDQILELQYLRDTLIRELRELRTLAYIPPTDAAAEKVFPDDKFNFVTVGKLHYHKGYDVLLRAFELARRENPRLDLTILGEGEERRDLENIKKELDLNGSVRMPGFAENPYIYLKQADAFVSSSRYEGFSNVIVEALACGTPVVATDCPSANREVLREGENGWFAEVENETSLAAVLLKAAAQNLNAELIRADCRARFALEKILPLYEELFCVEQ